jgi:hypothetical protein
MKNYEFNDQDLVRDERRRECRFNFAIGFLDFLLVLAFVGACLYGMAKGVAR